MSDQPDVKITKHHMSASEIRTILKQHKPIKVHSMVRKDDGVIEYLSLKFNFLGVELVLFSRHNHSWDEDNNVDWKQFIIDARLKGINQTYTLDR